MAPDPCSSVTVARSIPLSGLATLDTYICILHFLEHSAISLSYLEVVLSWFVGLFVYGMALLASLLSSYLSHLGAGITGMHYPPYPEVALTLLGY